MNIQDKLAELNDPDLTRATNELLVEFRLGLYAQALTNQTGLATHKDAKRIAKDIADKHSEDDQELATWLYQIMMADRAGSNEV